MSKCANERQRKANPCRAGEKEKRRGACLSATSRGKVVVEIKEVGEDQRNNKEQGILKGEQFGKWDPTRRKFYMETNQGEHIYWHGQK